MQELLLYCSNLLMQPSILTIICPLSNIATNTDKWYK